METTLSFEKIFTQPIRAYWLEEKKSTLDVLRLDQLHDVISGNKWFKLKYYLRDAKQKNYTTIATFGGPYSNHIAAAAYACHVEGFNSIGIIRGEEPAVLSETLRMAHSYGMQLEFVNRASYRNTDLLKKKFPGVYWIEEGGYGILGVAGAGEILHYVIDAEKYSYIICAVGTGTMMAGIITAAAAGQQVIGVSVMKGNYALMDQVTSLLPPEAITRSYSIVHDYHFGGYAKHPDELIRFMNETWQQHQLPTDIVYTSKTFYAAKEMLQQNVIDGGTDVLLIHSGGLQGNQSLPEKMLCF